MNRKKRRLPFLYQIAVFVLVALSAIACCLSIHLHSLTEKAYQTEKAAFETLGDIEALGGVEQVLSDINTVRDAIREANASITATQTKLADDCLTRDQLKNTVKSANSSVEELKFQYGEKAFETLKQQKDELSEQYKELNIQYLKLLAQQTTPSEQKVAYLTFDDGCSSNTDKILDILAEYNVKATFFVNWKGTRYADQYRRIVNEGHALGNHTSTHDWDSVYANPESFRQEVTSLSDKLYEITGVRPEVFRFPGGSNNTKYNYRADEDWKDTYSKERRLIQADIDILYELGYQYFDWNVDSTDASSNPPPAASVLINKVLTQSARYNNPIILMHDTASKTTTVEALPEIIEGLLEMGFRFEVLTSETAPVQFVVPAE